MRFKHVIVFLVALALGASLAVRATTRPAAAAQGAPTSISSSNNPSRLGESVTFSATVQGVVPNLPLGGVIFLDNGAPMNAPAILVPNFVTFCKCIPDGSSTAQFSTSSLSGGAHVIIATALSQYGPSASDPLLQTVRGATTTTVVTAAPSPPTVFGQSVTFTATVTANPSSAGTPTGSVQFSDNGSSLGGPQAVTGGAASVSAPSLTVGAHNIVADYTTDSDTFVGSSGSASQQVDMASTMTGLASTANPSVFGQAITLTATVAAVAPGAGTPTGTLTFSDGAATLTSTSLTGGQATFTSAGLSVGSHNVTATYNGDGDFKSSSASFSQTVNQAPTSTSVTSSANPTVFGQKVSFTATVCPLPPSAAPTQLPSGTVTITADGASTPFDTQTISTTSAPPGCQSATTVPVGSFSVATHAIAVAYQGDANFLASSTTLAGGQVVNKAPTATALVSAPNPSLFGDAATLTATITVPPPGAGTPTGTVTFSDRGFVLGTSPLTAAGQATFTTAGLQVGTHALVATYGGDGNFLASTSPTTSHTVRCLTVVTGKVNGGLTVSGSTCVNNATVDGGITVRPGAALSLVNSTVNGGVTSSGAKAVTFCADLVHAATMISTTSGFVLIGDNGDDGFACAGNDLRGDVTLTANAGQIELGGNLVKGGAAISGTTGSGPSVENQATEIEGNHISGHLSCSANTPAPIDDGSPNESTAGGQGQCAMPNF